MSKRTPGTTPRPRDFWPTPPAAVLPLVPHLREDTLSSNGRYIEPCAGAGALVDALAAHSFSAAAAFDIEPQREDIRRGDASKLPPPGPHFPWVTNPPWSQHLLMPILANAVPRTPVWLLLPLDYAANLWMAPWLPYVDKLVPLGRVSWLGNGKGGYDNAAWMRFSMKRVFHIEPRTPKPRKRKGG